MEVLYNISEALACLLYFIFSLIAMEAAFSRSSRYHILCFVIAGIFYFPLTFSPIALLPNLPGSLLSMGIIFVISLICYSGKWIHKLLAILLYNTFDILLGNICFFLGSLILDRTIDTLSIPGTIARIYILLFIYLIEFVILSGLKKHFSGTTYTSAENIYITILFFLSSFVIVVLNYYILFYLSDNETVLELLCLLITCFMLFVIIITLLLLKRLQKKNQQLLEYELLQLQITEQEKQLHDLKKNEQRIREIRHDIKNYLISYHTLLSEGKVDEVLNDLNTMIQLRLAPEPTLFCSNQLVNTMLIQKDLHCREKKIPFLAHAVIADSYNDIEMITILSNIIDNAIEASEELLSDNASVSVDIVPRPNAVSILIRNHIEHSVLAVNPNLNTTKADCISHGIGLKSAKRMIEKRNGILDIYEEKNQFCVQIYLPIFFI